MNPRTTTPRHLAFTGSPITHLGADHPFPDATRRSAMITFAPAEPRVVLVETTKPGAAVVGRCSTRTPRRFVFIERPTQTVIDELCRIDLR